jgi:hypothetical protein
MLGHSRGIQGSSTLRWGGSVWETHWPGVSWMKELGGTVGPGWLVHM